MKQIFKYFTEGKDLNFLENQKTKAFIVFNFVVFFILIVLIVQAIIIPSNNLIVFKIVPAVIIFLAFVLFILKQKGIYLVGNIFSVGLVLAQVIPLNIFDPGISILIKYTNGFYLILALIVISGMFASKNILIINAIIIIITTTRGYLFGIQQLTDKKDLLTSGFILHTIALIAITVIIYFIIKFNEKAIYIANKEAEINKRQNKTLVKMVAGIKESSEQIYTASEQLSSSSQQISQNANEQAATTEEISASMEQMLSMINSNTKNAAITEKTTTKSAEEIKQSKIAFLETIKSVTDISEKTKIIMEISDKTDILSINAAIEAARSGEIGKGFAVVANEIRKLADRTKSASDEITQLSTDGQNVSKIAGDKLEKLIPEIIKSAALVNKIVRASKEQQSGIEAINISVQQLTQITNENSASAEEMSASAEELSAQAGQLRDLISGFNTVNEKLNDSKTDNNKEIETKTDIHIDTNSKGYNLNLNQNPEFDDNFESY